MKFALAASAALVACVTAAASAEPDPAPAKFDERAFIEARLAPLIKPGQPYPDALDVVVAGQNPFPEMTGLDRADSNVRNKIYSDTLMLFHTSQYDKLEAMAASFRTTDQRTPAGDWKLFVFYGSLDISPTVPESEFDRVFKQVKAWREAYPKSPTPLIVESQLQHQHAWKVIGNCQCRAPTPADAQQLGDNLDQAFSTINQADTLAGEHPDPQIMVMSAKLAKLMGARARDYTRFLAKTEAKNPAYMPLYREAVNYYAPMWNHDPASVDRLAQQAAKASAEGAAVYAQIYYEVFADQGLEGLGAAKIDTALLRKGVADFVKAYPDRKNFENFARMARAMNDLELARPLMARLQVLPIPTYLGWAPIGYQSCRGAIYQDDKAKAQAAAR